MRAAKTLSPFNVCVHRIVVVALGFGGRMQLPVLFPQLHTLLHPTHPALTLALPPTPAARRRAGG